MVYITWSRPIRGGTKTERAGRFRTAVNVPDDHRWQGRTALAAAAVWAWHFDH
jgi:hypothetical protein